MMDNERAARICGEIQTGAALDDDVADLADYCTRGLQVLIEGGTLIEAERQQLLATTALMLTTLTVRFCQHTHRVAFGMPPGFERIDTRGKAAAAAMVGLQLAEAGDSEGLRRSLHEAIQHVLTEANAKSPFLVAVVQQLYSGPLPAMVGADMLADALELEAAEMGIDAGAVRARIREVTTVEIREERIRTGLVDQGGRPL